MRMIRVANTTLFHVAAQELGDATQWNRIASLNAMNDPLVSGVAELLLPPYDLGSTGGLPGQ